MHIFLINILIFNFLMSSTCFEPDGSSSGRRLYTQHSGSKHVEDIKKLKIKILV